LVLNAAPVRIVVATVLVAAGCGISEPSDGTPTLDHRVTVLPDLTGMVVDAGSVTIPRENNGALANLPRGTILVSAQGEGFLREVDSVAQTSDSITFATHDTDLSEALVDGSVTTSVGGAGKADTYQLPGFALSFADQVIANNETISATLTNGSLTFEPELDVDLAVSLHSLESFEMVLRGKISGELDLDLTAHQAAAGPEIRLWESSPMIFYQQVGPLPVVETVTTSVVLRLQATTKGSGHIRVDAGAVANFEGGLRYTDEAGWDGVGDASVETYGSIPDAQVTFGAVGVRAWLAARADVRLYGIAGPFVMAGPQAELSRTLSGGDIDASVGLRVGAGGGLKFMRFNLPVVPTFDILDVTKPIL
jgi:hypothetical protein